ncbi:MAG: histidine--tRNA ligase [Gammaproteobacteria bacterium]|nr:histidine--tRNA ligase [Gammaproteobacteria bacterium]
MTKKLQAIRGMNDILPSDIKVWQQVESIIKETVASYGYQEIRFPIVEDTSLFKRTIGDATDIVEKEMYTFSDKNGESLTLRPEGTAGCVRAGIEHGLLYNQKQRLWYMGPMFRHERPQKGRYRQFYQFGVENFGMENPATDAELILLGARLWQKLRISEKLELQINSLGSKECRDNYKKILIEYFSQNLDKLDSDSQRRLNTNPLRILDSKNPEMQDLIAKAPDLLEHLDDESKKHFEELTSILDQAKIKYVINPRLVRGLDYYGMTVFEWIDVTKEGAQNAVCAGGRYNSLVSQLGGQETPASGFALGLERLIELSKTNLKPKQQTILYLITTEKTVTNGMLLAEELRDKLQNYCVICDAENTSMKAKFKRADKSGADMALVFGEDEMINNEVTIKYLRDNVDQKTIKLIEITNCLV